MTTAKRFGVGTVEDFCERLDERCKAEGLVTDSRCTIIEALEKLHDCPDDIDYNYDRLMDIKVISNSRPKGRAGQASYYARELELHGELFKEGRVQDLYDTFIHELAHFMEYWIFGNGGHGRSWKATMIALGADPTRCHKYEYLSGKQNARYVYSCISCGTNFNYQRNMKNMTNRYHVPCKHKVTRGRIELIVDRSIAA